MTPEIEAIKTNIRQLRADLVRAERELAGAYGPRIAPLSELFLARFNCDELRRGRCTLRTMLLRERPRCAPDIEAGLKDWGIT